jgi:hypothetical protein
MAIESQIFLNPIIYFIAHIYRFPRVIPESAEHLSGIHLPATPK